jgi:hypothetical protein
MGGKFMKKGGADWAAAIKKQEAEHAKAGAPKKASVPSTKASAPVKAVKKAAKKAAPAKGAVGATLARRRAAAPSAVHGGGKIRPKRGLAALDAAPFKVLETPGASTSGDGGSGDGLFKTEADRKAAIEALDAYRAGAYDPVHAHLRGTYQGKPLSKAMQDHPEFVAAPETVRAIDRAMDASKLTEDIEAWRGVTRGTTLFDQYGPDLPDDLSGKEFTDPGFTSVSTTEAGAKAFAAGSDPILMRIVIPKGTGAVQLSRHEQTGGFMRESEILLERGLTYKVVADHGPNDKGVRELDVQVVPQSQSRAIRESAEAAAKDWAARLSEAMGGKAGSVTITVHK